ACLSATLGGCAKPDLVLLPVRGKVLVKDQPIARGTVRLQPDAAKGNATPHTPQATIDADGSYEMFTVGKRGAPPGWYRVAVIAMKDEIPYGRGPRPPVHWLAPQKYTNPNTSQLAIEVKATAPPEGYDLRLMP